MRNFKKLVAMGTALAMAMIMSISAFADGEEVAELGSKNNPITDAYANGAVVVSSIREYLPEMTKGSQYTVVVVPDGEQITDSNIHYINQADGIDPIWLDSAKWGTPDALADNTYVVRVGNEAGQVSEIYFRVGEEQSSDPVPVVTFMNGATEFAKVDTVDGKATLPTTNPTYEDAYTFVEWVTREGNVFTDETVVETDTTVYPKFESNFIVGDANADSKISILDVGVIVNRAIGGATEFTDEAGNTFILGETYGIIVWGDANIDSKVSILDVGVIVNRAIGGDTEFTDEDGNTFKLGESFTIINK